MIRSDQTLQTPSASIWHAVSERVATRPADPRHPITLLPLLPSGPDGVHSFSLRGTSRSHHRRTCGKPADDQILRMLRTTIGSNKVLKKICSADRGFTHASLLGRTKPVFTLYLASRFDNLKRCLSQAIFHMRLIRTEQDRMRWGDTQ